MTAADELRGLYAWLRKIEQRIAEIEEEERHATVLTEDWSGDNYMRPAMHDPGFRQYLLRKQLEKRR
jgi:hypothetical protein